jgi:hypothetical protein
MTSPKKILIVEDEALAAEDLKEIVSSRKRSSLLVFCRIWFSAWYQISGKTA